MTSREMDGGAAPASGVDGDRELKQLPTNINEAQIKRIISVTGNLPPVPHVAAKMMELVGDAETSVKQIQKVISADQALTARILKMANSVFYSFDQKIGTLSHAIVILGFRAVQSMAIAASCLASILRGSNARSHHTI